MPKTAIDRDEEMQTDRQTNRHKQETMSSRLTEILSTKTRLNSVFFSYKIFKIQKSKVQQI